MRFLIESDTITPSVPKIQPFLNKAVTTTLHFYEPQVENSAKRNAPWKDQTTNARNGLRAASGKEGDAHFLVLAHQVPYGVYLETRWAGKFAVIVPTLQEYGPRVMKTLSKILERFGS